MSNYKLLKTEFIPFEYDGEGHYSCFDCAEEFNDGERILREVFQAPAHFTGKPEKIMVSLWHIKCWYSAETVE